MSCKEDNTYVGEIRVLFLFGHVSSLLFTCHLSLSLQISREKEKHFFFF